MSWGVLCVPDETWGLNDTLEGGLYAFYSLDEESRHDHRHFVHDAHLPQPRGLCAAAVAEATLRFVFFDFEFMNEQRKYEKAIIYLQR